MIQDKIFFDEKDPTGVSYNTPFTVYGSYEGRLWSKTPSGTIKYYTQNSDLSVYATTGSNSFNGNQTVTGSLTVTGGITGSVTTASYVEYASVANKPTLVSGSAQVSFNGITDKPTLVSGSSQITYSGLSSIPAGIVSSSAQVGGYGIFATTGSNQFNGSQAITGSLTVTGQVVAQTLNVQQVTSSIVFSSGSNIFGNSLSNTQQFTGSVSVTGSLAVAGALSGTSGTLTGALSGTSATFSGNLNLQGAVTRNINFYDSSNTNINAQIQYDQISSTSGQLFFGTNNAGTFATRLTISNTGAATFSSSVTATTLTLSTTTADYAATITNVQDSSQGLLVRATDNDSSLYLLNLQSSGGATSQTWVDRFAVTKQGNVGIGTNSPSSKLDINIGNLSTAGAFSNAALNLYNPTNIGAYSQITFGYTVGATYAASYLGFVSTNQGSLGYGDLVFGTRNVNTDTQPSERLRITSAGNVIVNTSGTSAPLAGQLVNKQRSDTTNPFRNGIVNMANANSKTLQIYYDGNEDKHIISATYYSAGDGGAFSPLTFFTSDTERMRITSGGDLQMNYNPGGGSIYFRDTTNGAVMFYVIPATYVGTAPFNSNRFLAANSSHISFETGGAERMRITSEGAITMSVPTSGQTLTVSGKNNNWTQEIRGSSTTGQSYGLLSTAGSNASDYSFYTQNSAGNIAFFSVRGDGAIFTGNTTTSPYNNTTGAGANLHVSDNGLLFRSTSSSKYKTNILDYNKGLNEVLGLRPVFYKGKTDGDTQFAGLIAEEVHELGLTEFVQYAPDGSPDALAYQNMIALAFKAIQELKSENDTLKSILQRNNIS
jgi:hypothetical protein